jgi:hypothetical protein
MAISVSALDIAINTLLADMNGAIDYSVGDKAFSNSQKLSQLMALRQSLTETPEVDLDFVQFDWDINLDGTDTTQTTVL